MNREEMGKQSVACDRDHNRPRSLLNVVAHGAAVGQRRGPARIAWTLSCVLPLLIVCAAAAQGDQQIEFNRNIRPILSNRCFACHGPDGGARQAELRLDLRADATEDRGGYRAIAPGDPDASEMVTRIESTDADDRMPPAEAGKPLTQPQQLILRQWIQQGAVWQRHWSQTKLVRPPVPGTTSGAQGENAMDRFIRARLERESIKPSPRADRRVLIRRLSFDLTGLPPTPEAVRAFVQDDSPDAYGALVERLLASPHYGERLAIYWLDLVRYADTLGYHGDQPRNVSPYRDYVIDAFNANLAFDQFTVENLAGDLLPHPTLRQRVASTCNRLNRASAEGGVQPKEYLAKYAADRVRTTAGVWLASTLGCAQCHDHKFDPFTTKDFYSFAAFFADIKEQGIVPGAVHIEQLPVPTPEQARELQQLDAGIARTKASLEQRSAERRGEFADWLQRLDKDRGPWLPARPVLVQAKEGTTLKVQSDQIARQEPVTIDRLIFPPAIAAILDTPAPDRTPAQADELWSFFLDHAAVLAPVRAQLTKLREQRDKVAKSVVTTLATSAGPPRITRVLPRGNWMDESGEVVQPAVPEFLGAVSPHDRRANRLDLARWIVSSDNPLTARAFVNRLWMLFFGQGIARSVDDLGSQGQWPTHPALLDWLAVEFIESGWDVKHMIRLLVMSQTYQQTSAMRPELVQRDPLNKVLARQASWRLDAEIVRDNALAVSGLLVAKIGGPSVKPYQPPGYWSQLNFPKRVYTPDVGDQQYRRGIYTHWQRTYLHPSLLAFDAPPRDECTARRERSNTPLQALALLNDPTYVEAARVLAASIVQCQETGPVARLQWAFNKVLMRHATDQELATLSALLERSVKTYRAHPEDASRLVHTGLAPVPDDLDLVQVAAWTSVARALLNLHETITRY